MKHAYLILTNGNWRLLNLLLEVLDSQENTFFIFVDQKTKVSLNDVLIYKARYSLIREVSSVRVNWGGFSLIQATINLLKSAVPEEYDYYHFMSGSDFPIKNAKQIGAFFEKNRGYEFVNFAPEDYEFAKWKCEYRHIFVDNRYYRHSKVLKVINHGFVLAQKLLGIRKKQDRLYHGSEFFSITHSLAQYVIDNEQKIRKSYRAAIAADEVFVQTLIMHSEFNKKIFHFEQDDGNAYYIDWNHRQGNSPKTLDLSDIADIVDLPEQYCFARKFSDDNIEVVKRIIELTR